MEKAGFHTVNDENGQIEPKKLRPVIGKSADADFPFLELSIF